MVIGTYSDDTIFAPATGIGRTAVAIIRVSGCAAAESLRLVAGLVPEARRAYLTTFRNPSSGDPIDRGLVLWFPGPASFTGEDCAEFHLHGGQAVLKAMVEALAMLPGLRPAEAGEFTRRAFGNGKMDLAAAEGVADLIDAETEAQRRQALSQMNGRLAAWVEPWRKILVEARALVEAEIDFPDEGEAPTGATQLVHRMVEPVLEEIDGILRSGRSGEIVREGFSVVLAGPPNAGKSTLLNAIAKRDIAIVTEHAGTTRDVLEARLDLDGLLVVLADTAGIRNSDDPVEIQGISRSHRRIAEADLVLWLAESGEPTGIPSEIRQFGDRIVEVATKIDLHPSDPFRRRLAISARTGQGMAELVALICERARSATGRLETALISRARHRHALVSACTALKAALEGPHATELVAENLRLASRNLESIVGRIDVEQILDEIFAKFCMGK